MARHLSVIVILTIAAFVILSFTTSFGYKADQTPQPRPVKAAPEQRPAGSEQHMAAPDPKFDPKSDLSSISTNILTGDVIAPKLENATIKAELGRASWKLLHTMMARFPENPTADDSLALKTYIQLFARLYPCGDCAHHFQKLLAKYPPQVSSRNAAAGWACFMHNIVNEKLRKETFDCQKLGDFYDCGCGEDDKDRKETSGGIGDLKLEKEGLTRGG
ncbi:ERV/ALR sulfhydryl oxidase domain-containing protein [Xylariaceae sp. FL0662B]|nr:ERV/ALR sulfhydryl oxidase domain-containing protein [Xylariaceae sp. FL0662B]